MAAGNETESSQHLSELALNSLRKRLGEGLLRCQLCGENDWLLQDKPAFVFLVPPDPAENSLLLGGSQEGLALVVMTCKICGNTLLLNSKVLEIHQSGNLEKETSPKHG